MMDGQEHHNKCYILYCVLDVYLFPTCAYNRCTADDKDWVISYLLFNSFIIMLLSLMEKVKWGQFNQACFYNQVWM